MMGKKMDFLEVRELATGRLLGTLHNYNLAPGTKSFSWAAYPKMGWDWAGANDPMTPVQTKVAHAVIEEWHFQFRDDIQMLLVDDYAAGLLPELRGYTPIKPPDA